MKPRRTKRSNRCFILPGGNEDNDLWVEQAQDQFGSPLLCSYWVPNEEERQQIAEGAGIELRVWGRGLPPMSMVATKHEEFRA